ncbi:sensory transduction histidine kinase [Methanosarcina lacustris Z-7289]|uniref:histidine kinase n=1 Tax=Methanosarcina lacustris Z-7289 TaxID=1434111 RepID=A0A0E3S7T3_9EURY|nr:ATP-binding protein [Methanosarcina lacustris]AKB75103.1 sensory transduction histidine kinase [Methanosarcina lacustris Z-7289]
MNVRKLQGLKSWGFSFTVRDTGIGIPKDSFDKIFKPFIQIDSTLNRTFERTGLGLILVKKYVEIHGGNIHVESKIGEGSSFRFELPATQHKTVEPVLNILESQKTIS